jgi:exodeoxyribonuclease VII small subunit
MSGNPSATPSGVSFEKGLERLQAIVKELEGGQLSLDQSLSLFEEGVKLTKECQGQLTSAEQKVQTLMGLGADGKAELAPFNPKS